MPISSSAASVEKKKAFKVRNKSVTPNSDHGHTSKNKEDFLTIGPALPKQTKKPPIKRAHSTLTAVDVKRAANAQIDPVALHNNPDGSIHISRTQKEKETNFDRISLDRRGLTCVPIIEGEVKLRLLSLQHNLINNLDSLKEQQFPNLVFLDIYDNQLEKISNLDNLYNLRVLLMGKNRIKKIEGFEFIKKLEVLDLHGNQISQVSGLSKLADLKVLNLAGNQLKNIGVLDFDGLVSLQELNLRRNRLKKLLGFGSTPNLQKLFLSNNEVQAVEEMSSIAKSTNIKELSLDNNPVSLGGDCISFLVSYLPHLINLNNMQVTEQVRKAAMAWRRNKESTNSSFMDLRSEVCLNVRRDEVISNARTNWELLRSQTKCLSTINAGSGKIEKVTKLKPDTDFILTSLSKPDIKNSLRMRSRTMSSIAKKVPLIPDNKKLADNKTISIDNKKMTRTNSQDTENSQNTSSSNTSHSTGGEFFRLPPILVPIINKLEQKGRHKRFIQMSGGSLSSIGPNVDSSVSSLASRSNSEEESESSESSSEEEENLKPLEKVEITVEEIVKQSSGDSAETKVISDFAGPPTTNSNQNTDTSSNLSSNTTVTLSSNSGSDLSNCRSSVKPRRNVKSATNYRLVHSRVNSRAATAKPKKHSPTNSSGGRDREQGGDYLIEICGRHLNIYGQGALRFIDKTWCATKAIDVHTINFNYANFNSISSVLSKIKHRFSNADHFVFKETNMHCLGQINALAEIQGLGSLTIGADGNPIMEKSWESYAVYRLSHWGLKIINGKDITEADVKEANEQYQSLSDLALWSLPDILLEPLLVRLRIDVSNTDENISPKKWLMSADPALRSVVSKEALQWKKPAAIQDDLILRQKAKNHIGSMLDEMCNTVNKLRLLDAKWPSILHEIVKNTLIDYSQLDMYMKRKMQELK